MGQNPQVRGLKTADIVVACPGRLEDLIGQGHCRLSDVEITVLDEADHMADLGFLPSVRRLLSQTPKTGQRLLFSATLDKAIDGLVRQFLRSPVTHQADSAQSPIATMAHHVLHIQHDQRVPVLVDLTSAPGRTVVFTRTKHRAKSLARQLNQNGVPTVDLHGNLSQGARTRNMEAFHSGRATTLVATDVAARGIHVDDVALVVHADPPSEHKAYLHRSGRTARAGAEGTVITLMTDDQVREVRTLTRAAGVKPTTTRVASMGDEVLRRLAPGQRTLVAGGLKPSADAPSSQSRPSGRPGSGRPRRSGGGPAPAPAAASPVASGRRGRGRGRGQAASPAGREVAAAQRRVVQLANSLTVARSGRPHVHHVRVGRGVREPQPLVEPDGRHVVGLDVEQHLVGAAVAQVP